MAVASAFELTVEEVRPETAQVRTIRFALPRGADFHFVPGQCLSFHFADDPKNERTYSIASSPLDFGFVEVSLAKAGVFTKRFCAMKPGDTVGAKGPFGRFLFKENAPQTVFIAGGTGVTPARSIVRYTSQKKLPGKVSLLYSARMPSDFLYKGELEEWAHSGACAVHLTITRPHQLKEGEGWKGLVGRVDVTMIRRLVRDLNAAEYYICGPGKFVEDVAAALGGAGVPKAHVHFEKQGEF